MMTLRMMVMVVVVVAVMMLTIVLLLIPMLVWGHSWSRRGRFLELTCPVWGGALGVVGDAFWS